MVEDKNVINTFSGSTYKVMSSLDKGAKKFRNLYAILLVTLAFIAFVSATAVFTDNYIDIPYVNTSAISNLFGGANLGGANLQNVGNATLTNLNVTGITYPHTQAFSSDQLIGYWDFNNNSNDNSGKGHVGFAYNGASYTTDQRFGSSATFDGVNDYILVTGYDEFSPITDSYTICGWVKPGTPSSAGTLFGYGDSTNDNRVDIGIGTDNTLRATSGNNSAGVNPGASGSITIGSWSQFCYIYNAGTRSLYINNVLQTGTSTPGTSALPGQIVFGARNTGATFYNGSIDNFMIFKRVLSEAEMQTLYESNYELTNPNAYQNKINYNRPQGGTIVDRPLFSTGTNTLTVCSSGCTYTTIQDAVNHVPYFLNHRYTISITDGTYNENVFVPPMVVGDIVDSVDGACEALVIKGNSSNINGVKVKSFELSSILGCQTPAIEYMQMTSYDPYSDENVSIAIYGSQNPVIKFINFTGVSANNGIMAYGSTVTVSAVDFGNNDLQHAILAKHGGTVSFNDAVNTGSVKSNLGSLDDGSAYLNNDTIGMTWVGDMFSKTNDQSGIALSRDISNGKYILHFVNSFQEPIQPQTYGASTNGLIAYYKGDDLLDYSGNGHNLSSVGSGTLSPGKFGDSFTSNGVNGNNWIASDTVVPNGLTQFSYFAWANIKDSTVTNHIFRTGAGGAQTLYLGITSGMIMKCGVQLNTSLYETSKSTGLSAGSWHFYGCTYNGTGLTYYLDGKYLGSVDTIDNGALNLSTSALTVNARPGNSLVLNGSSDEIMIFNRTLTTEEMRSWYEAGVKEGMSPQAYYLKQTCTWEGNYSQGTTCSDNKVLRGINQTSQQIYCC